MAIMIFSEVDNVDRKRWIHLACHFCDHQWLKARTLCSCHCFMVWCFINTFL